MTISRRLHSSMFIRPDDEINELPKRIVFLSVEGNTTEKDYFKFIQKFRTKIGIDALVYVETLSKFRHDTKSDPDQVFDLLKEYLEIRKNGITKEDMDELFNDSQDDYTSELVEKYLKSELPYDEMKKINTDLQMMNIDVNYQKYLSEFKGENNEDVFAIVIDRDCGNHTEETLSRLFEKCKENNCLCFITNPCFEFWLLLHLSDVKNEYHDKLTTIFENKKISNKHTFVSYEVSQKAGHGKSINERKFTDNYLNNIDKAIERASDFCQDQKALLKKIGSNIPALFEILKKQC